MFGRHSIGYVAVRMYFSIRTIFFANKWHCACSLEIIKFTSYLTHTHLLETVRWVSAIMMTYSITI